MIHRETHVAAAVIAPPLDFFALDDGESGIDVTDVVTALGWIGRIEHAIEDEIEGIKLRRALLAVGAPSEGEVELGRLHRHGSCHEQTELSRWPCS